VLDVLFHRIFVNIGFLRQELRLNEVIDKIFELQRARRFSLKRFMLNLVLVAISLAPVLAWFILLDFIVSLRYLPLILIG